MCLQLHYFFEDSQGLAPSHAETDKYIYRYLFQSKNMTYLCIYIYTLKLPL